MGEEDTYGKERNEGNVEGEGEWGKKKLKILENIQVGVVDFSTMDEKNITLIDNLDIQKDDFTVKVRIIRLWSQPLFKDPQQIYSIEMILMDEEWNKVKLVKSIAMEIDLKIGERDCNGNLFEDEIDCTVFGIDFASRLSL
ncbi:hypothetical protein OSB04_026434 [Centaurea solstitialis]|uniref:DUF223 domain-containing protein n=1 Tax=Centaurea solstitialis TaxID=347529 RepID=A0AA38SJC7_9ASTR|nr:hypothetical protein OSB04_026434 [Centaurea solstitialis]